MLNELNAIFENIDKEILNENTLQQISSIIENKVAEKVDARVTLEKESALKEQEEDFTTKLQHLVETLKTNIDKDHLAKIKFVVEKLNTDYVEKLITVKENYEKVIKETAVSHKNQLVDNMDRFLESYIDEKFPTEILERAATNTHLSTVLNEARKLLSVDETFIKAEVKEAFIDGKKKIDTLVKENAELKKASERDSVKRFLAEKTHNLPTEVTQFVIERLANKPLNFVKENFAYVVNMHSVKEKKQSSALLNESKPISNVDRAAISGDSLIQESTKVAQPTNNNPHMDQYLEYLNIRRV